MNQTAIEWTDFSANPLKFRDANGKVVWGCVHASPGCVNCYAETLAHRYGKGGPFNVQTMANLTPFLDERELHKMLTYKPASGKRCFVGDMTDVFGEWVPSAAIVRLFGAFAARTDVVWQVLTKRAERMHDLIALYRPVSGPPAFSQRVLTARNQIAVLLGVPEVEELPWPLPNVWLGVSVEDQQRADERIPHLLQTPAAIRFVSAEPLLGPVQFKREWWPTDEPSRLDWVIPGGESNGRPCDIAWIRSLVNQCAGACVACFVKQLGSKPSIKVNSHKGNDMAEWPEDLRVRQFPLGSVRP